MMSAPPHPDLPAPGLTTLWAKARFLLELMAMQFGTPLDLVRLAPLTHRIRADILYWLEPLEALVRKLLLLEAAALTLAPPIPRTPAPRAARPPQLKPRWWRRDPRFSVPAPHDGPPPKSGPRIRLLDGTPAPTPRQPPPPPPRFRPCAKYAWRYAALLRVVADPAPHARRLAARLRTRPHYARRIAAHRPKRPLFLAETEFTIATRLTKALPVVRNTS